MRVPSLEAVEKAVSAGSLMARMKRQTEMPHTIMIDKDGMLRANFLGYGPELHASIAQQMDQQATKTEQISSQPGKIIR